MDGIAPSTWLRFSKAANLSNDIGLVFLERCQQNAFCKNKFDELDTTIYDATKRIFDGTLECVQLFNDTIINNLNDWGLSLPINSSVLATIFYTYLQDETLRIFIPPIIYRMTRCNEYDQEVLLSVWSLWVINTIFLTSDIEAQGISLGLNHNIALSEMWYGSSASDPGPTYDELIEAENTYFFVDGMDPIAVKRKYWDIWNRYTPNPLVYNKYADPPIPMLLLNGDLDPATPIKGALIAAQAYGADIDGELASGTTTSNNRYFLTIPNAPHIVLHNSKIDNFTDVTLGLDNDYESCGMYIIKSFIDPNNGYVPDDGCLKWLSDIDFEGTSNVSKQTGSVLFGTGDIWGVQSIDTTITTSTTNQRNFTNTVGTIDDTKEESTETTSNDDSDDETGSLANLWDSWSIFVLTDYGMVFVVAIICLFVVSIFIICCLSCCLCSKEREIKNIQLQINQDSV